MPIDWLEDKEDYSCLPDSSWEAFSDGLRLSQVGAFQHCRWQSRALSAGRLGFTTSVDVELSDREVAGEQSWVGFTFGWSEGRSHGLSAGVTATGHVFVGKHDEYNEFDLPDKFRIEARGITARDHKYYVFLEVFRPSGRMIGQWISPVEPSWLEGTVALTVSNQLPPLIVPWEAPPAILPSVNSTTAKTGWLANFDNWVFYGERVDIR
ncbi:MAG: hypothetical protein AAF741_17195 [Bacteroidota bacterium]